jgi:hypothetical protein
MLRLESGVSDSGAPRCQPSVRSQRFFRKSESHQTGTQTAQPVGMSTAKASRGERDVTDADRRTLRELTETFERLLASGQAAIEQLRTITDKAA